MRPSRSRTYLSRPLTRSEQATYPSYKIADSVVTAGRLELYAAGARTQRRRFHAVVLNSCSAPNKVSALRAERTAWEEER